MTQPGFATQQELLRWASSIPARSELPRLIRRLVLEAGRDLLTVDFPAAEGVAVGGWDGVATAEAGTPFVPSGLSLWELSAGQSTNAKASTDYQKRTATPDDRPPGEATYIAVSLRRWRDRRKWASERGGDNRWKEVRAYGIDDVETWLESAPITHAWISEQLGLNPHGLQTANTWWESWSTATNPSLTTEVVLAGRDSASKALRGVLAGAPQLTTVRADSLDEVLAYASAVALEEDLAGRGELLARIAFVDDVGTWRSLASNEKSLVLLARSPEVIAEARTAANHHVIVPLTGQQEADIEVPSIDAHAAAEALVAAGMEDDRRADELARLGRRSLLALRRRLARKPELHTPVWARGPGRGIRAILLAGAWNDDVAGDQQVISQLAGLPYEDLRERLTELAADEDPVVTRVGQTWTLVSPYDTWRQLRTHIRTDDLARLRLVFDQVLLEEDPAVSLPVEDRWRAGMDGKTREYSADLRAGLAATIALLGALGERVDAGHGSNGRTVANSLVRGLFSRANADDSGELWAGLSSLLPLFSEGAPDAFLEAVRAGVVGHDPVLGRLFQDGADADPLFSSSSHTGLLWALEAVAWSPSHLGQAVDLLARLVQVDPGGRLINRPSDSLESILCPWHPETTASNQRRLEMLDELRNRHPSVAWPLMVSLLPEWHGIHHPTSSPRFRDWKPSKVSVTNRQWLQFVEGLIDRLIEDADEDPARWQTLVKESDHVSPSDRARVRIELGRRVDAGALADAGRDELWEELRALVARHREYSDADWALPGDELDALGAIERKLAPLSPPQAKAWLFEDHMPDLGGDGAKRRDGEYDHAGYTAALDRQRLDAVSEVDEAVGWAGVLELLDRARVPGAVGNALAQIDGASYEEACVDLLESEDEDRARFAVSYFARRFFDGGWAGTERVLSGATLTPGQVARLLLVTGDYPRAWQRADELGDTVSEQFWRAFMPFGLGADYPHVAETASRLCAVGRSAAAIQLLVLYEVRSEDADPSVALLAANALDALLKSDPPEPEFYSLREYDFESLFEFLEQHRNVVGIDRVAGLEWAYLPALGIEPAVRSLQERLAEDPAFFVEVLSAIYRRRSDPPGEVSSEQQQLGTNAYRLLRSWNRPPGVRSDGALDADALGSWVRSALMLLREKDRLKVGELHIGYVLAFTPGDVDGSWPCVQVRDLVEELQSDKVEQGLSTQVFNNRGVTSRNPESGGDQERALAKTYAALAERFTDRWPRTAAILRQLADTYEHDARRNDEEAERRRKGLEP